MSDGSGLNPGTMGLATMLMCYFDRVRDEDRKLEVTWLPSYRGMEVLRAYYIVPTVPS
jgi:hypothetical protein